MKKIIILSLSAACLMFSSTYTYAQDTLVIDEGNNSIMQGTVDKVRPKEIVVLVNGKSVKVDIQNLNIGSKAGDFFPVGTNVEVIGQLIKDDQITARKMTKIEPPPQAVETLEEDVPTLSE